MAPLQETVVKSPRFDQSQGNLRYAWYVVIILMACYTLSFVDRQILSLLVGPIKRDLAISDTRIGLLQGFAFALFYTFMGLPLGRIADKSNRRNLIVIGIVLWSIMTAACAAAKSFWSLFAARIGVGVGEATLSPSAFSIISDYFPKERLGIAMSVYTMGIFIGTGLALAVGGTVVDAVTKMHEIALPLLGSIASWRLTFLIVGAPGLLMALLTYTIREPKRRNLLQRTEGQSATLSFGEVFAQIRMRWQSVAGIAFGMIFQSMSTFSFTSWTPVYFQRVHGWSAGQTGRTLGLIVLIFGCLGMYVGGILCDYWQKNGIREAPLRVGVISAIGAGISFGLATIVPDAWLTIVLLCPGIFFIAFPIGSLYASIQLIFPNQVRGQVSAVMMFVLNLGGLSLGPLVPALLNDYVFHDEKMVGASIAISIAGASTLLLVILLATYRSYRLHHEMMYPLERVDTLL